MVIVVLLLRGEIKALFRYVKKLKAGSIEAEFEREIEELRASTEASPTGITPEKQVLLQLVQINPRSAVLEAWRGIEEAAIRVVQNKAFYVPPRESSSPLAVIRSLSRESVLSPEEVALYHELRSLRNQAAHADDFSPTVDAALNYIELAGRLRQTLEKAQ